MIFNNSFGRRGITRINAWTTSANYPDGRRHRPHSQRGTEFSVTNERGTVALAAVTVAAIAECDEDADIGSVCLSSKERGVSTEMNICTDNTFQLFEHTQSGQRFRYKRPD